MAGFHFVLAHQSYKVRYIALKKKTVCKGELKKKISQDPIRGVIPLGPQAYSLPLLIGETFPLLKVVLYYFMSYLNQLVE